jgi:hypothetical protein
LGIQEHEKQLHLEEYKPRTDLRVVLKTGMLGSIFVPETALATVVLLLDGFNDSSAHASEEGVKGLNEAPTVDDSTKKKNESSSNVTNGTGNVAASNISVSGPLVVIGGEHPSSFIEIEPGQEFTALLLDVEVPFGVCDASDGCFVLDLVF